MQHPLSPIGYAIAIALVGSSAFAQTTPSSESSPPTQDEPVRERSTTLETVIITAQKRSESSLKAPLAVSAIAGEQLRSKGAVDAKALSDVVPNVNIGSGNSNSFEVSIRGVVSTNNTEVGDPAASVNLDGVGLARPQAARAAFVDLERVEVLRGPQGTLYGRNSTAGAVNIITNKPMSKFGGSALIGVGNYNQRTLEGVLNVPVNEVLSLRGVLAVNKHDGYMKSTAPGGVDPSDADTTVARLHVLLKPDAQNSLLLTADMSAQKGVGPGATAFSTVEAHPRGEEGRKVAWPAGNYQNDRYKGLAGTWESKLGFADLTVLAAERRMTRDDVFSFGGNPSVVSYFSTDLFKQDSVEARLSSSGTGPLKWVTGVYWFKEEGHDINQQVPASNLFFKQKLMQSESYAAFGQATYSITDTLRLTGGLRYTHDEKLRVGGTYDGTGTTLLNVNDAEVSYNKPTWKIGIDTDLSKDSVLYASIASGYKAGGIFDGASTATAKPIYNPENLVAYEIGVRGRFLDNTLQLGSNVFLYDYKDMQLNTVAINPLTGTSGNITYNAASARVTGLEFDGQALITPDDRLTFAVGLLRAKYGSFIPNVRNPEVNWSGYALQKAPKATVSLGYTHTFFLESGADVTAYVGTKYSSSYVFSNFGALQNFRQPSYTRSDISLTYNAPGDRWNVQLYGKNLEDRNVMEGFQTLFSSVWVGAPRTFGIRAGMKF